MQVIITEKCTCCGANIRVYNKKHTFYFGPEVHECPKCKSLYLDRNAIELSTKSQKYVKDNCKDFMIDGQNFLCFIAFVAILMLASHIKSEEWVNQSENFLLLAIFGFGIPFLIKCLIKYLYFWKKIYPDSVNRMNDEEYLAKIERYNQMIDKRYNYADDDN